MLTRGRDAGPPPASRPRHGGLLAVGLVPIVVLGAACSSGAAGPSAGARPPRATSSSAPPTTTTPVVPTTTTTIPATFPSVIVQAMAEFAPLPAGARAPIRLPATSGDVTAETGGLGGEANVTLIATSSPVAVDSPALANGDGTELASFSTTPTASAANAAAQLTGDRSRSLAACQGPSSATTLSDGTRGSTCATAQGEAIDWTVGRWSLQVLALDGADPPTAEANRVESSVGPGAPAATALPSGDAGGILSVVVPGKASAGSADTAALEWTVGADVYQVRSSDDPDAALAVAAAMRPYPA